MSFLWQRYSYHSSVSLQFQWVSHTNSFKSGILWTRIRSTCKKKCSEKNQLEPQLRVCVRQNYITHYISNTYLFQILNIDTDVCNPCWLHPCTWVDVILSAALNSDVSGGCSSRILVSSAAIFVLLANLLSKGSPSEGGREDCRLQREAVTSLDWTFPVEKGDLFYTGYRF